MKRRKEYSSRRGMRFDRRSIPGPPAGFVSGDATGPTTDGIVLVDASVETAVIDQRKDGLIKQTEGN